MPTILTSTEDFNAVYDKHKGSFETNTTPSFHNLLWQFIVNNIHDTKLVSLTVVLRNGRTELGIAEFNEPGYIPTSVGFTVPYDKATDICDDLNLLMFGQADKLSMRIIASSYRKVNKGMKELGDRNYTLIKQGVKATGSYEPDVCLPIFEEELYTDEVDEITAFLKWVSEDPNERGFGSSNYEEKFAEFKAAVEV